MKKTVYFLWISVACACFFSACKSSTKDADESETLIHLNTDILMADHVHEDLKLDSRVVGYFEMYQNRFGKFYRKYYSNTRKDGFLNLLGGIGGALTNSTRLIMLKT